MIIYAPISIIYIHIDIYQYNTHTTQYLYTHKDENETILKIVIVVKKGHVSFLFLFGDSI